jgi:hypothetical protein
MAVLLGVLMLPGAKARNGGTEHRRHRSDTTRHA